MNCGSSLQAHFVNGLYRVYLGKIMNSMARFSLTLGFLLAVASSPVLASDLAKGKKVFNKCRACHNIDKTRNKVGPHLVGIFGRTSGTVEGFKYSKPMKDAAVVWNQSTLDVFLTKPKNFIKGTKMRFVGLKKQADRENIIGYLKSMTK
jgi:cytochrome c